MQKITTSLRTDIGEKLSKAKYSSFHKENFATYIAWLQNDVSMIESNFLVNFFILILNITQVLVGLIALTTVHWSIAIVSIVASGVILLAPKIFEKRISNATMNVSTSIGMFIMQIQDMLSGFDVLYAFNKRKKIYDTVHATSLDRAKKTVDLTKAHVSSIIFIQAIKALFEILILALTGFLSFKGLILISAIIATGKISSLVINSLSSVATNIVEMKSVKDIIAKFETIEPENLSGEKLESLNKSIEVKNLSFSYPDANSNVLSGLSLEFEHGKKYGIVGESGVGKTTLFKLLFGMLEDYTGDILIDGKSIKEINIDSIRETIAYIDQNVFIFNNTIRENLCLGSSFSEEEILESVKNAGLEEYICETEAGLDTLLLQNGHNLSGGQKQRIAIARALLHGKRILLVDEATSSLDKNTSLQIEQRLFTNPDLTVIMISHHFSDETTKLLDKVYSI